MFTAFKKYISKINPYYEMSRQENVSRLIPTEASYVTIGYALRLNEPLAMGEPNFTLGGLNQAISNAQASDMKISYLARDEEKIYLIDSEGIYFETAIRSIEKLATLARLSTVRFLERGGFCVLFADGSSIVLSTQMPVEKPQSLSFRTIGVSTDVTGGWAEELSTFAIKTEYGFAPLSD